LLGLALESAKGIMSLKLVPEHKDFAKLMARQTSIVSAVLSTTARIDEARLRGRGKDKVHEILKAIEAEKKLGSLD
jgi:hypothetical protein